MIGIERENDSITFEGTQNDFRQFIKQLEKTVQTDQKGQVTLRVKDDRTGQLVNLIFRKGKSRDSL